jgi:hypothetical protein
VDEHRFSLGSSLSSYKCDINDVSVHLFRGELP